MDDVLTRAISWVRRHVFLRSEHVAESVGAADKGRPILTDSNGQIDATLLAAATLLAKLLTVDGAGSGLDADKLDSLEATAFALLAGRSGGQALNGGTAAGDVLTFDSTSDATKGDVLLNPSGGNVGIGTNAPSQRLHVKDAATTARLLVESNAAVARMIASTDGNVYFGSLTTGASVILQTGAGTSKHGMDASGSLGVSTTSPTLSDGVGLHINGKLLRIETAKSPASNGTGNVGEICWDSNYLYVCTASNTWKRVALTGGY